MNLQEYQQLKRQVDLASKLAAESQGALKAILADIKHQFDVDLDGAVDLLKSEEKRAIKLRSEYDRSLSEFKRKWEKYL